jgi:hypothetical protein
MSTASSDRSTDLAQPVLTSPRRAEVVDGSHVQFNWDPVENAQSYTLQVSTESTFEPLVVDQDLGISTEITLSDIFPSDHSLFYWRVLVRVGGQTFGMDVIESFTSGTHREAVAIAHNDEGGHGDAPPFERADDPDHHDHHLEITAVEEEGLRTGPVFKAVGVISLLVAVVIIVIFQIGTGEIRDRYYAQTELTGYPELVEVRAEANRLLDNYYMGDAAELAGTTDPTYRIPIGIAMSLIAAETQETMADSVSVAALSNEVILLPAQLDQ